MPYLRPGRTMFFRNENHILFASVVQFRKLTFSFELTVNCSRFSGKDKIIDCITIPNNGKKRTFSNTTLFQWLFSIMLEFQAGSSPSTRPWSGEAEDYRHAHLEGREFSHVNIPKRKRENLSKRLLQLPISWLWEYVLLCNTCLECCSFF